MSILHIVALLLETLLGLFMAYAAYSLFSRTPPSVAKAREAPGYPHWYWTLAGCVATISAIGLLALPVVAGIAIVWTIAYFVVATFTHLLRKDYAGGTMPLFFLVPVLGLLVLQWATLTPILAALGR